MDGILPIAKPAGMTSYDVVRQVKRMLRAQEPPSHKAKAVKVGHAGTLDPFAEGVLLLLLGKATKKFDEIRGWHKTYLATARLGVRSSTLDRDGTLTRLHVDTKRKVEKKVIEEAAEKYVGESEQVVPAYAAAKHKGRKLYEYAREGKEVPEKKKTIIIYKIIVEEVEKDKVVMRVECGGGTYIRQLSYDILKECGVESYLDTLVRESVGEVGLRDCVNLEQLTGEDNLETRLLPFRGE